ncbi:MAG TPA: IPT/TIG domain-containing protein, partial [Candidatus Micrarchaeaceae archaeon]|nr:IPT/TIG domain-containing protein [Candidatus Micrarchaeaceae archaeon]
MEHLEPQRRVCVIAVAALVLVGTGSFVSASIGLVGAGSASGHRPARVPVQARLLAQSNSASAIACFDLPISSALLYPESCWRTGPTSALIVGTEPGSGSVGEIAIVTGQRQQLVQLPGSGPLQVTAANGQSGCVADSQQEFRSVDLVTGVVSSAWSSQCALSAPSGAVTAPALTAPSSPTASSGSTAQPGISNSTAAVPPSVTPSYYEYYSYYSQCDSGITGSCPLYAQGASTHTPPQNGLVVLDFGAPCYVPSSSPLVFGVEMFFQPTCIPAASLVPLVENWIAGYESQNQTSTVNLTLGIGTSNSFNGVDSPYYLTSAEMTSSGQSWYQNLVGAISTSGLAAPLTIWGADDMEQSSDNNWYSGPPTVAWVQGFDGASPARSACPLGQSGYLADYGDDILGGSGSADGWTVQEIYDVAWGNPGSCAEPEIYYATMATEWQALSQWGAQNAGGAISFSGVMTEIESGTLSPNAAWGDLESDSAQSPPIPSVTTISWTIQNLPVVSSVSPEQGPIAGGTPVTVTGVDLSGAEAVDFGSTPAASYTVNNSGSISATAPAGSVGFVDVTVQTAVGTSAPSGGDGFIYTAPAGYHPVVPVRIEDTRPGSGLPGAGQAPGADQVLSLQVTGAGGIPSTGVSAVVLNVTVAPAADNGLISVFPTGTAVPIASNINFAAGQTKAAGVEVALGRGGQVSLYNNSVGTTQLLVDVEGWYDTAAPSSGPGLYNPVAPARIVDTRSYSGNPTPYSGQTLGPGQSLQVTVAGAGGIPSVGPEAAVLNLTAVDETSVGDLRVFPTGASASTISTLNFVPGQAIANQVVALLGTNGAVTISNSSGSVDVLVDVEGWYTGGSGGVTTGSPFNVLVPTRAVDTRPSSGGGYSGDTLPSGQTLRVNFEGLGGIPTGGVTAVVTNVTVANSTSGGDLAAWPADGAGPITSELNWSPGQIVANLAVLGLGADGSVEFQDQSQGSVDLIIDLSGWFGAATPVSAPVVDSISPASGPTGGGTQIAITGANFTSGLTVYVGGVAATGVTLNSSTSVTATTPAGTAGFADVTVTTTSGSSQAQGPDGFLYEADGAYHPVTPTRVADTRAGSGLPYSGQAPGPGQLLDVSVTGLAGVPATGVAAVVVNLTVTEPSAQGFVTAFPTGLAVPNSSTIDFSAGQTDANLAEVAVGRGGQISIYNLTGWTQVIVDVEGWYDSTSPASGAGLFNALPPQRIADTRPGTGT